MHWHSQDDFGLLHAGFASPGGEYRIRYMHRRTRPDNNLGRLMYKFVFAAALSILTAAPHAALADTYPAKPVTLVVPYGPGGSVDWVAREIGKRLGETMGQPFVVENKSGASANIGANYVAKSKPDGYTLLMSAATTLAAAPSIFKSLPYDPRRDLTPVSLIVAQPNILVVHPSLPVHNVQELIEVAKTKPDSLNAGIMSLGGPQHMSGELFMMRTGVKFTQVPYRDASSITDLLSGQVNMMFAVAPEVVELIASKKLRPLAMTTRERSAILPDVPTLNESGLADYELIGWIGMAAPSGTPTEVIERLNKEIDKALADPAFQDHLRKAGLEPRGGSVDSFAKFIAEEADKYRMLVKASGMEPL